MGTPARRRRCHRRFGRPLLGDLIYRLIDSRCAMVFAGKHGLSSRGAPKRAYFPVLRGEGRAVSMSGMGRVSAGLVLFRRTPKGVEVLLVHPGGPFFAKKDLGSWTIPKGEFDPGEEPLDAAKREFKEETGAPISGKFIELVPIKQTGGKIVMAWAVEGNIDAGSIVSN